MSRVNSLGYVKKPSNPPSIQVDGKATVASTLKVDDVDMGELNSRVQTLENKGGGSVVDGPIDFTSQDTTQYAYFADAPRSTQATHVFPSYQIVGNRITVFGQIEIVQVTGMNSCDSHIPYPVIDGKTYAMDTTITDFSTKFQLTGSFSLNGEFIFPRYAAVLNDTQFFIEWTKPDFSVWANASTGTSTFTGFSITYIWKIAE